MSITGGVKFAKKSKILGADGATITASTGNSAASAMLDRRRVTLWKSVGSDDATTETITITPSAAIVIDRLWLIDINLKDFSIDYDSNGSNNWTDFTNVTDLDQGGAVTGISYTTFSDSSGYWEFDSVTVYKIRIRALKTQTADEQKRINQVIATEEMGTLNGFPEVRASFERMKKNQPLLSGRVSQQEGEEIFNCRIIFRNYPTASDYQSDINLIQTLNELNERFICWPCGGRRGSTYFRHVIPGFRLEDIAEVRILNDYSPEYERGITINGVRFDIEMIEAN